MGQHAASLEGVHQCVHSGHNISTPAGGKDGGIHVTDISNAARTNWMDISTGRWHAETMAHFGATEKMLPEIRSNAEVYG